jgi:RNA polymerase sigma-70 factor (family 1)
MPIIVPFHEKELLSQLQLGNERAFEQLYRIYSLQIFKKLLRLVKKEEVAKELLQDVFLRIWEKRATIDENKSFRAYLYCIAQNLVTDLFRRAAYDRKLLQHLIAGAIELYNPIEDAYNLRDGNAALQQALNSLSPQRKKVYTLCKMEGKSYEEVSLMLGISTSTISDHIVKATKLLKTYFAANEGAMTMLAAALLSTL